MSNSKVMSHDENKRQEFKENTLRRVYNALNNTAKTVSKTLSTEVTVKGLQPKNRKEE